MSGLTDDDRVRAAQRDAKRKPNASSSRKSSGSTIRPKGPKMPDLPYSLQKDIDFCFSVIEEKLDEVKTSLESYTVLDHGDLDGDELELAGRSAMLLLQSSNSLVRDLRAAGAPIEPNPVEDEAMVSCLANAHLIWATVKDEISTIWATVKDELSTIERSIEIVKAGREG